MRHLRNCLLVVAGLAAGFGCAEQPDDSREANTSFQLRNAALAVDGFSEQVRVADVDSEFFSQLQRDPLLGRIFVAADFDRGVPVAVISADLWRTTFEAEPAVVGSRVALDGVEHVVLGVMPDDMDTPPGVMVWAANGRH